LLKKEVNFAVLGDWPRRGKWLKKDKKKLEEVEQGGFKRKRKPEGKIGGV